MGGGVRCQPPLKVRSSPDNDLQGAGPHYHLAPAGWRAKQEEGKEKECMATVRRTAVGPGRHQRAR